MSNAHRATQTAHPEHPSPRRPGHRQAGQPGARPFGRHHQARPPRACGGGPVAAGPWRRPARLARRRRSRPSPQHRDEARSRSAAPPRGMIRPGRWSCSTAARRPSRSRAISPPDLRATIVTHSPSIAVELERHRASRCCSSAAGSSSIRWSRRGDRRRGDRTARGRYLLSRRHRRSSERGPDDRRYRGGGSQARTHEPRRRDDRARLEREARRRLALSRRAGFGTERHDRG